MAEVKLSAATRRNQGVPSNFTHSGVIHIKEFQPDRYTIVGNHLAQHGELSLTAIGLAVHILSLPEGAPVDIRTLAARFPEGRDRIAFALRELESCGYIARVRERAAGGHLVTRTYAYNAPAITRTRRCQVPSEPSDPHPVEDERPAEPVPPVPEAVPEVPETAAVPPEPSRSEHHDKAESLLIGLRRTDTRFTLSQRDVRRLIPAVVAWFDNGVGRADVHHALTANLPTLMSHPAGFLAHRLKELLPPPLPSSTEVPVAPSTDAGRSRPHPWQDCEGGCNRVFRAPEPGRCRDCRSIPMPPSEVLCAA